MYQKILFAVLLVLVSCTLNEKMTYSEKLAPWIGQDSYALFKTWGRPDDVFAINGTDYAWVYVKKGLQAHHDLYQNVFSYEGWQGLKYGQPEQANVYYCKTYFTIRNGLIINYSFNGDDCS
ncbi:MAG: hypothetical protein IJ870_03655 [Alphaproteobacteria bacterium]|nr:hypothetical protein [Alphaproteobacteria bacterium]